MAASSHRISTNRLTEPFAFFYLYVFFTASLFYWLLFFYGPGAGHGYTWMDPDGTGWTQTDPNLWNIYCRVLDYQLAALRSEFIRPSLWKISKKIPWHWFIWFHEFSGPMMGKNKTYLPVNIFCDILSFDKKSIKEFSGSCNSESNTSYSTQCISSMF